MPLDPSTLDEIFEHWRKLAREGNYNKERIKGTTFEDLCRAFLEHDPVQKNLYELPIMTYKTWSKMEPRVTGKEKGIDLVAKMRDGGLCAIQCKFYAKGKTIPMSEITKFVSNASKKFFTHRILIDTTGVPLTQEAEDMLRDQDPPVSRIGYHDLIASPIDWVKYVQTKEVERKTKKKTPYPHQVEAIEKVVHGLQGEGSRGMMLMACGTGKTFTSLRIAEELAGEGGRVLYLVPSLALMSQTVREWAADTTLPPPIFWPYAVIAK